MTKKTSEMFLQRSFQDLRRPHKVHFDMEKRDQRFDFNIRHLSEILCIALRFSEQTDFETEQREKCCEIKVDS